MRYALVNGMRVEAQPGQKAVCPGCKADVVARCGRIVVWHWAHTAQLHCDQWWEPETEWHRAWKDRFPNEWQEVPTTDSCTGELHIADVRTEGGLVIELQRSGIGPEEVRAREAFYSSMVWVVDGRRSVVDRFHFSDVRTSPDSQGIAHFQWFSRSSLFARWRTRKPVFIDFGRDHGFWRVLHFDAVTRRGQVGLVNLNHFIDLASRGLVAFGKHPRSAPT